ncbi:MULTISPECIES: DUF5712 family protein [Myroides]|uniref:DUF5712 family protein n=1 Tax=Myroides TaxID=76831 RepID=UPI00103DEB08|nr:MULTISPECIES: DUF5712 family protein [Myroides]MBB1151330.1 hypothetical protein [Myroides sp. NP-2]QBK78153.1 hypothetical protein E0Z07_17770 [Myroides odoratimimus]WHT75249.1 DUF5712 family protein [Myroides odoratimimus]WHU39834.1 DUF5712 family protein [Myroides odoratimimus]
MHISYKAHDPQKFGLSSQTMIEYLTKEEKTKEAEVFYNHEQQNISPNDAYNAIDNNKGSHGKDVSKFYMMNISPSQKELNHLENLAEKFANESKQDDLTKEEIKKIYVEKLLQEYTYKVMDDYAKNFERDKTIDDLVYFAKIEHNRTFKENDKDVIHNKRIDAKIKENPERKNEFDRDYKRNSKGEIIRNGLKKEGNNTHIHVVVSRYEKKGEQRDKASLSPMSKARKSKGLNNSKVGFDRDRLNQKSEERFDDMFDFKRMNNETYQKRKENKKGYDQDKSNYYDYERQSKSNKKKNDNAIVSSIKDRVKEEAKELKKEFKDALKSNGVDVNLPTSLKELQWKIERDIKQELGMDNLKSPKEILDNEIKSIRDNLSKGIDIGY